MKSAAGHVEKVTADEDSPEFRAWVEEARSVERVRAQRMMELSLDYGVVSWLLPLPEGLRGSIIRALRHLGIKNWRKEPPRGWEIPERLARYGVSEYYDRRLTYLQLEILVTTEDLETLYRAVGSLGRRGELTDEEVQAAERSFPEAVERGTAAGSAVASDSRDRHDTGGNNGREAMGSPETQDVVRDPA